MYNVYVHCTFMPSEVSIVLQFYMYMYIVHLCHQRLALCYNFKLSVHYSTVTVFSNKI